MIDFVTGKMTKKQKIIYKRYAEDVDLYAGYFDIENFILDLNIKIKIYADTHYIRGMITKEKNIFTIHMNRNHGASVKAYRVYFARLLAHFFHHKKYLNSNEILDLPRYRMEKEQCWLWKYRESLIESPEKVRMNIIANQFALELLLPSEQFIRRWRHDTCIASIAESFCVPPDTVMIRASNLLGEFF